MQIEKLVADETIRVLSDWPAVAVALEKAEIPSEQLPSFLTAAGNWCQCLRSETNRNEAMGHLVDRVDLKRHSIRLSVSLGALLEGNPREATLVRDAALGIKRRGVEMRLVIGGDANRQAAVDRPLLKEVARAHRCFEALLAGRAKSIEQAAALEEIDPGYTSKLLPLAFLSPEIVKAIMQGTQPPDLTAKRLIRRIDLPLDWQAQKRALGFQ